MYLETMQQMFANASKILVDTAGSNNMLYLPLDKITQQAAQGVQAQAYGQASQTYQMPFQQMGAYSPFYGAQANMQSQQQGQEFQLGSSREQRAYDVAQTRANWQQQERMGGIQFGQQQQMFQQQAREEAAATERANQFTRELTEKGYSQQQAQQIAMVQTQQATIAQLAKQLVTAQQENQAAVTQLETQVANLQKERTVAMTFFVCIRCVNPPQIRFVPSPISA
jgi:hypothetical protein